MGDQAKSVRSVERALQILSHFMDHPVPFGVGEVARLTQMPKSTAYRLLSTLRAQGYLQRTADDEKFQLGPRLQVATTRRLPDELRTVGQPVIDELRDTCGETIGLHVLEGSERLCIAAAEGVRNLRTSGRVGSRAPLYSGASAKSIMAFLPEERWEEIIASTGLVPLTSATITDPVRLRAELNWIRKEGHAISKGEWDEGITSVAAPIFDRLGHVVGSVNISGPSFRLSDEKISLLVGALKAAAEVISLRLMNGAGGIAL